jgi:hypothetical protein
MRLENCNFRVLNPSLRRVPLHLIAGVVMCIFVSGCGGKTTGQLDPLEISDRIKTIKSLTILPPQIKMTEISAGGTVEEMHEWNDQAEKNLQTALIQEFKNRQGITAIPLTAAGSVPWELNVLETYALMNAIESALQDHSNPTPFDGRYKQSVFTLGPEVHEIAPTADAILLIQGTERRATAGRQAARAGALLASAATIFFFGVAVVPAMPGGTDPTVSVDFVDTRYGRLLWYRQAVQVSDLRTEKTTDAVMRELFNEFPLH